LEGIAKYVDKERVLQASLALVYTSVLASGKRRIQARGGIVVKMVTRKVSKPGHREHVASL
jgi:hypothetical protein